MATGLLSHRPPELPDMSRAMAEKHWKHTWGSDREEQVLGKGTFGKVTLMMHRSTGQLAARKQMHGADAKDNAAAELEIAAYFYRHPHPNILRALASIVESNAILFQHCDESLEAQWSRQCGVFEESAARHLMGHLLNGRTYAQPWHRASGHQAGKPAHKQLLREGACPQGGRFRLVQQVGRQRP